MDTSELKHASGNLDLAIGNINSCTIHELKSGLGLLEDIEVRIGEYKQKLTNLLTAINRVEQRHNKEELDELIGYLEGLDGEKVFLKLVKEVRSKIFDIEKSPE